MRAYCPNTSRLIGLLEEQPRLLLSQNNDSSRKTDFTVQAIENNNVWVGIYALRANNIFERYLKNQPGPPFSRWRDWEREVQLESSQIDFCGKLADGKIHWLEIKSLSSRWQDGTAFYSGTPSRRGYRHLRHLSETVDDKKRASCVFVIQRPDVTALKPAPVTQQPWLKSLREAEELGVKIRAFRCRYQKQSWSIIEEIPTEL